MLIPLEFPHSNGHVGRHVSAPVRVPARAALELSVALVPLRGNPGPVTIDFERRRRCNRWESMKDTATVCVPGYSRRTIDAGSPRSRTVRGVLDLPVGGGGIRLACALVVGPRKRRRRPGDEGRPREVRP